MWKPINTKYLTILSFYITQTKYLKNSCGEFGTLDFKFYFIVTTLKLNGKACWSQDKTQMSNKW
jgi:hypothetical protein